MYQRDEAFDIAGEVKDSEGKALRASLRLLENGDDRSSSRGLQRTALDGSFRFTGLEQGSYTIHATAAAHAEVHLFDVHAGEVDVEIVLKRMPHISGTVITSEGNVVTSFQIAAVHPGRAPGATTLSRLQSFSNATGTFELSVPHGTYDVVVQAPGYATGRTHAGNVFPGRPVEDVVVVLAPHRGVEGIVVDAAGAPVGGAALFIGPLPSYPESATDRAATMTDAEGHFRLPAPESGEHLVLSAFHATVGLGAAVYEDFEQGPMEIRLSPPAEYSYDVTLEPGVETQITLPLGEVPESHEKKGRIITGLASLKAR